MVSLSFKPDSERMTLIADLYRDHLKNQAAKKKANKLNNQPATQKGK
jgi:hypothetical protein